MYYAIEGIDGSGKSTLVKELKNDFPQATFIREPGTSVFAEGIRSLIFNNFENLNPFTIQLAMLAARSDLKQSICGKDFIISDRCFLSGSYCDLLQDESSVKDWITFTKKFIAIPDLIIYLDITAETSFNRISTRKKLEGYDTLEIKKIEKRISAYKNWINISKDLGINIITVDGNKALEEVKYEVSNIIKEYEGSELCKKKQLISEAKKDKKAVTQLLSKYDFVFRVCALRFCTEDTFEDFVQEGALSLLERSIPQYDENENFLTVVIKNCLRYQRKFYLDFYVGSYSIFNDKALIDKYGLYTSLFSKECMVTSNNPLSFEETRDFVKSFIYECKDPRLQKVLELLYRVED